MSFSQKYKVLIVSPDMNNMGGIANYYRLFFKAYENDSINIEHFANGTRSGDYHYKRSAINYIELYFSDLIRFVRVLLKNSDIRIVQFNPSMIPLPIVRDGLMLLIAKVMGRKTILFFRGWDEGFVAKVNERALLRKALAWLCRRSDKVIILAQRFKKVLISWGVRDEKIGVSWTTFDGGLVAKDAREYAIEPRFLFLSRISEPKGVFHIVEAASALRKKGLDFQLTFVGFGKDESVVTKLKECVEKSQLSDVTVFKGYLDGEEKFREYAASDVFLLPSSHPEGCPNSVLEAMASGLFVVSTDVGALREIVKEGVNGLIVKQRNAEDLADKMLHCIENLEKIRQQGQANVRYAFDNFEAKKITEQFKSLYHTMISPKQ